MTTLSEGLTFSVHHIYGISASMALWMDPGISHVVHRPLYTDPDGDVVEDLRI